MGYLVSAKGVDIINWRATTDFSSGYRQALLDLASAGHHGDARTLFSESISSLRSLLEKHNGLLRHLEDILARTAGTHSPELLKDFTGSFYGELYHHFELFQSAPAYYQMSTLFLHQLIESLLAHAVGQLGNSAHQMPLFSLVALGPAGRNEFSPCCPLQILLVHGDASRDELDTLSRFCVILHSSFEECGLLIDPVITPRNPVWRGSCADWEQRCREVLHTHDAAGLIDLLRLADQHELHPSTGMGQILKQFSIPLLRASRPALTNLVKRMTSLSNGISLMGHLKLDKSGPGRGMFNLLEHGLLPLSSAVSAISLIKGSRVDGTPQRVRDLLTRREMNVDLAERMLNSWHTLHEFALFRELQFRNGNQTAVEPLYLDPASLDENQHDKLKEALESVAVIQRQVGVIFYGMEE